MPVISELTIDQAVALGCRHVAVEDHIGARLRNVDPTDLAACRSAAVGELLDMLGALLAEAARLQLPLEALWGEYYASELGGRAPAYDTVFARFERPKRAVKPDTTEPNTDATTSP